MTIDEIEIDPIRMRQGNTDALSELEDTELIALNKDAALNQIELAIYEAHNLSNDSTDLSIYSDLLTANEEYIKQALMYLQLSLYYQDIQTGEGSKNYLNWINYNNLYNSMKAGFAKFKTTTRINTVIIPFSRG